MQKNTNKDFCVFILTHGRPDNVITYKTLKKAGCTYPIYFIIDNEDETAEKYYENFGKENVIMFDKKAISKTFDEADNFDDRRAIVYARNACFDIAKKLGYTYFIELDDDYTAFEYRPIDQENNKLLVRNAKNIDAVFRNYLEYFKSISCKSIALAQGGDYIGGAGNSTIRTRKLKRKAMNSFICSVNRPFKFVGRINEDVNTYTLKGSRGNLFFTIPLVSLTQKATQSNSGGMTDIYLDSGTYIKSFYTVIMMPSSVVASYQSQMKRIHHSISWNNTCPKILDESYKKVADA